MLTALLPEVLLTGWALVLLCVVAWRHRTAADLRLAGWGTLAGLASAAVATWWLGWNAARPGGLSSMIAVGGFAFVPHGLFPGGAGTTRPFRFAHLDRGQRPAP